MSGGGGGGGGGGKKVYGDWGAGKVLGSAPSFGATAAFLGGAMGGDVDDDVEMVNPDDGGGSAKGGGSPGARDAAPRAKTPSPALPAATSPAPAAAAAAAPPAVDAGVDAAADAEDVAADEEQYTSIDSYAPYAAKHLPGLPHPSPLRMASALSSSTAPPVWLDPHTILPRDILVECALSREQLESVILATQSHETRLPAIAPGRARPRAGAGAGAVAGAEGVGGGASAPPNTGHSFRRAFLLGDAAGVGKGRQICSTMLAALISGKALKVRHCPPSPPHRHHCFYPPPSPLPAPPGCVGLRLH